MNEPAFYTVPGRFSEPGDHAPALAALSGDLRELCAQVQGLLIHYLWLAHHGEQVVRAFEGARALGHVQQRSLAQMLGILSELDSRPLSQPRPPQRRMAATCRHFALLLAAAMRQHGIPARVRCGFARYFSDRGYHWDHWICEIWRAQHLRWQQVDAQLDPLQCQVLGLRFDTCDLPPGAFLYAGQAWQACRNGQADPQSFGIEVKGGWGFIHGNVVRDLLALQRVEVLAWDGGWGLVREGYVARAAPGLGDPMDRLANASATSDAGPGSEEGVCLPPDWDFSRSLTLAQIHAAGAANT